MILAIDMGGTKTLVAPCDSSGKMLSSQKFPTPKNYKDFIKELKKTIDSIEHTYEIVVMAAPGKIDRKKGEVISFGNLPWKNTPLQKDLEKITGKKVIIENDANLAGLSEAISIKPLPHKVLYVTVSTGIGTGFVTDGVLDSDFLDSEGGNILLEHDGKLQSWEHFASGKAIVAKYGLRASDINDPKIWDSVSKNIAIGLVDLSAVLDPDVIVIGGGVGTHFAKFEKILKKYIKEYTSAIVDIPSLVQAQHAEEAVIYGCIELAKQHGDNK